MTRISVHHEILKKSGKIRVRKFTRNGYDQYRIKLSISGPLDTISHVEYELHPTFKEPIRISKNRTEGFPIDFWTWGEFEILVTAHYLDGSEESTVFELKYGSQLPADSSFYFDETPLNIREGK